MTNLYTDNIELYHALGLQNTNHALFTIDLIVKDLPYNQVWNQADKIFVISNEGFGYRLLRDTQRPNLFVWDSVLDSTLDNYQLLLEHWDRLNIVDQELKLTDKLTNPLTTVPSYKFDVLLGHQKPHREFIFNKIITSNYVDQFLASYYKSNRWIPGTDETENDTLDKLEETGHNFLLMGGQNWDTPLTTPSGFKYILCQAIPWKIYNKSWFSIVAESWPNIKFVTEKTGKALASKRLAIFFGVSGILAELKNLGFKTFDCVIDESYDNEPSDTTRWEMAWQQVERLCASDLKEVYTKCQPILEHNQQLFLQRVQEHNFKKAIEQISALANGGSREI